MWTTEMTLINKKKNRAEETDEGEKEDREDEEE